MKVLALGGAGEMGRRAAEALLRLAACDGIVVADRDGRRAAAVAGALGDRARPLQLDVADGDALRRAIESCDVVMNTVGPFYRFRATALAACIGAGRHYVDICDDWEPTLEMFELHGAAVSAGITALIGMGASPGITNVLARRAATELDEVEEIYTGWDLESAMPETIAARPSAATVHGFHQMTGTIRVFRDGRFVERRPLERLNLDYPGRGRHPAWSIGHPESVTLPRAFGDLRTSQNVMVAPRRTIAALRVVAGLVDLGVLSIERAAWIGERFEGAAGPVDDWSRMRALAERQDCLPPLFALAKGRKGGRAAAIGAMVLSAPAGGMAGVTGVPLAVGVSMVSRGMISSRGVFAPESVVDPGAFFDALAPFCRPQVRYGSDLIRVSIGHAARPRP